MNNTLRSLALLFAVFAVACGGPEGLTAENESNLARFPGSPTIPRRAYIDCTDTFDHLALFSNPQTGFLTALTVDYVGNQGAGLYEHPIVLEILTNGAIVLDDAEMEGLLWDNLDLTISGIQPTTATYDLRRKPKITQGLGGPTYLPGILGPEGESNATSCSIVRGRSSMHAPGVVMTFDVPEDDGTLTVTIELFHTGG